MRNRKKSDPEEAGRSRDDLVIRFLARSLIFLVLGVVFLPLAPALVASRKAEYFAQRSEFWAWDKRERLLKISAVLLTPVGLGASVWALFFCVERAWDGTNFHYGYLLYWAFFSLSIGLFFLPLTWLIMRWRISGRATKRTIDDVVLVEDISRARYVGSRAGVAHKHGAKIGKNGQSEPNGREPILGPVESKKGQIFLGEIIKEWPSLAGLMKEKMFARGWLDKKRKRIVLPDNAGDVRALVIAESGAGKSDFLSEIMQGARAKGWRVTFVDAKGDDNDAKKYARILESRVEEKYNAFTGTASDIRNRLFSVAWDSTGDSEYYMLRAMRTFLKLQARTPIASIDDLVERAKRPLNHLDPSGKDNFLFEGRKYEEAEWPEAFGQRFELIEPLLSSDSNAWTFYDDSPARVVPLNPLDKGQKQVGLLILEDFKRYIAWRRKQLADGVEMPQELFVFDEFAQLTGDEDKDPAVVISSLMETIRTAQAGFIVASQSLAGITKDVEMQDRLLASGASVFAGRSTVPDKLSKLSGTVYRKESASTAEGEQTSGRAQNTFVLPPKYLREAATGEWFLLQAGSVTPFLAYRAKEAADVSRSFFEVDENGNSGGFF